MRTRRSNNKSAAMTLIEVLVIIAVLGVLAAMLLPALTAAKRTGGSSCVSNLREIGLAYQLWLGDNNDKYPMAVSVTNGGAMELIATGNVVACFQAMSNELSTPKILLCPDDTKHVAATNFTMDFNSRNISYFINVDITDTNSKMFLSGDANLSISGAPAKSGLVQFSTNSPVAWANDRHTPRPKHFWSPASSSFCGNIGLGDGSVQQLTQSGLKTAVAQTYVATNRLAIP